MIQQNTRRIRTGRRARVGFGLDKIARVGMTIRDRRGRTVLSTSAVVGRGNRSFTWGRPAKPGLYRLRLTARDLAGNSSEPVNGRLRILRAKKNR